jgi:hypothetical protein
MVLMRPVASRRAGAAVILVTEIVARPTAHRGLPRPAPGFLVPGGTPAQLKGGEMSAPSQMYSAGIWLPGANDGLASSKA